MLRAVTHLSTYDDDVIGEIEALSLPLRRDRVNLHDWGLSPLSLSHSPRSGAV